MSPLFREALALNYRPDLNTLILRWPQPVYAFDPKEVYLQVLELAKETNARFWLFDVRSRGLLPAEDAQWVVDNFFQELNGIANQTFHIAYLVTPSYAEDASIHKGASFLRSQPGYGKTAEFEIFTSEPEALLWLKRCQLAEIVN